MTVSESDLKIVKFNFCPDSFDNIQFVVKNID